MYGLAVNLIVSVSGHPWIINEMGLYVSGFYKKFRKFRGQIEVNVAMLAFVLVC